jgi:hypothetical protein
MSSLIFPQFDKCRSFTLDPFWKDILYGCACNRFPDGLTFDSDKNEIEVEDGDCYTLPRETKKLFQMMMEIFRGDLGLRSTRDIRFEEKPQEHDVSWKKIKPKQIKNKLLADYITTLKQELDLTKQEIKHLTATINIGFQFKSLSSDDVEFDGKIIKIDGLNFDKKKRIFTIPKAPRCPQKTEKPTQVNVFYNLLDKYLKENEKRVAKYKLTR